MRRRGRLPRSRGGSGQRRHRGTANASPRTPNAGAPDRKRFLDLLSGAANDTSSAHAPLQEYDPGSGGGFIQPPTPRDPAKDEEPVVALPDSSEAPGGPLVAEAKESEDAAASAATVAAAAPNVPMLRTTEVVPLQPTGFTPRDPAKDLPDDGNAVNGGETSAAADNCLNPVVAAAKEEPKQQRRKPPSEPPKFKNKTHIASLPPLEKDAPTVVRVKEAGSMMSVNRRKKKKKKKADEEQEVSGDGDGALAGSGDGAPDQKKASGSKGKSKKKKKRSEEGGTTQSLALNFLAQFAPAEETLPSNGSEEKDEDARPDWLGGTSDPFTPENLAKVINPPHSFINSRTLLTMLPVLRSSQPSPWSPAPEVKPMTAPSLRFILKKSAWGKDSREFKAKAADADGQGEVRVLSRQESPLHIAYDDEEN